MEPACTSETPATSPQSSVVNYQRTELTSKKKQDAGIANSKERLWARVLQEKSLGKMAVVNGM
jgi:hypothetical protein